MYMDGFTNSYLLTKSNKEQCVNLLSKNWTLDSTGNFLTACIITCFVAAFFHYITILRMKVGKMDARQLLPVILRRIHSFICAICFNRDDWIASFITMQENCLTVLKLFLYMSQVSIAYGLMLIAMSYSTELFIAVSYDK